MLAISRVGNYLQNSFALGRYGHEQARRVRRGKRKLYNAGCHTEDSPGGLIGGRLQRGSISSLALYTYIDKDI